MVSRQPVILQSQQLDFGFYVAVTGPSWTAAYDIHVDTNNAEKPVTLVYKAAIKQYTYEDWTDVPLTLETATPTYGLAVPKLNPWTLSVYRSAPPAPPPPPPPAMIAPPAPMAPPAPGSSVRMRMAPPRSIPPAALVQMSHVMSEVVNKGGGNDAQAGVNATFQVPGLITIPSDGNPHNVTIARLELGAAMSWVGVPKKDVRMRLNAKIKNASQYTLLRGLGSIYVDGSFIAKSDIPG
ncbi:hypothetical protein H0H93_015887, partial [Arthromyces matolae]